MKKTTLVHFGSPGRTRTADKVVNSHLLYQLSYRGIGSAHGRKCYNLINRKDLLPEILLRVNKFFKHFFALLFGLTPMPIPFTLSV